MLKTLRKLCLLSCHIARRLPSAPSSRQHFAAKIAVMSLAVLVISLSHVETSIADAHEILLMPHCSFMPLLPSQTPIVQTCIMCQSLKRSGGAAFKETAFQLLHFLAPPTPSCLILPSYSLLQQFCHSSTFFDASHKLQMACNIDDLLTNVPTFFDVLHDLQMAYNIDVVRTNIPEALEVLLDAVANPAFHNWELQEQIKRLTKDIENAKNNPQSLLMEVSLVGSCHAHTTIIWFRQCILMTLQSAASAW